MMQTRFNSLFGGNDTHDSDEVVPTTIGNECERDRCINALLSDYCPPRNEIGPAAATWRHSSIERIDYEKE